MKINWSVRFKNKTFLAALLALIVTFVYDLMTAFGIAPSVEQSAVMTLANTILTILVGIGVLADPTTEGIGDSAQAMTYVEPKKDA